MSTERWHAVGRWVVEDCAEQPEEPMPLFQCDLPANAATVANIYNEVCTERDAAVAENARLLARIAAVEAKAERLRGYAEQYLYDGDGGQPLPGYVEVYGTADELSALAASPTPTGPEPKPETRERHHRDEYPACWSQAHEGHDVGWRHEDGSLYSATCYDCDARYRRPDPATPEPTEETP